MNLFFKSKSIWFYYPFVLLVIVLGVFFAKDLSFDIIRFKVESWDAYRLVLGFISYLPLILLFRSNYWRSLQLHRKILLGGLLFFLMAINFRLHACYFSSIIFSLSAIFYLVKEKKIYHPKTFGVLIIVYFVVNAISLFWTSNLNDGLKLLRFMSPFLYITLLFSFFRLSKKDLDFIFLMVFRFACVYVFYSVISRFLQSRAVGIEVVADTLVDKFTDNGIESFKVLYAWTSYMHPTYNAVMLMFALAIGWFYLLRKDVEDGLEWSEFVAFFAGVTLVMVLSASRYMLVAWLLINASGVLFLLRGKCRIMLLTATLFVLVGAVFAFRFSDKITNFYKDPVRQAHYEAAFESIGENTWHGTGLGGMTAYINEDNQAYQNLVFWPEFRHSQPHNQFVGDLMQTGVFGLTVVVVLVAFVFFSAVKRRNWLLLMVWLIFILLMLIEMPLIYEKGIFYFATIMYLLFQMQELQIGKQDRIEQY